MKAISLFSGAGGGDLALKRAGFDIIYANDYDRRACETYKKNIGDIEWADIREIDLQSLPHADLLLGGFPCQSFSIQGRHGGTADPRGQLYNYMIEAIKVVRPRIWVAENVLGLKYLDKGHHFNLILNTFRGLDYKVQVATVNFADYKLPQARKRLLFIGYQGKFNFPLKTLPHRPCLPVLDDDEGVPYCGLPLSDEEMLLLKEIKQGQSAFGIIPRVAFKTEIRRLWATKPAFTVLAERKGVFLHPTKDRFLTIREYARLQGFPDDYEFCGRAIAQKSQIGNAIPPLGFQPFADTFMGML